MRKIIRAVSFLAHLSWHVMWSAFCTYPSSDWRNFKLHWTNFNQIWHKVTLGKGDFQMKDRMCSVPRDNNNEIAKKKKHIKFRHFRQFSLFGNSLPLRRTVCINTQGCFAQSLVEIGQWFLRRRFLNFVNVFSLFRKFLPLVTGMTIRLNIDQHMNPLHPKDALYQVWLKMTQWFLKRGFLNFVNVFRKCPWKTAWPFIWTKLNSLYPRMFCAKFGWNWLSSSWEEDEHVFTDRQTEGRRSEKLTWAFSSGELKVVFLSFNQTWNKTSLNEGRWL